MPDLWAEQGLFEEIWNLPHLFQDFGLKRGDPRGDEVELVRPLEQFLFEGLKEQNT
jgi:hypothetical protein